MRRSAIPTLLLWLIPLALMSACSKQTAAAAEQQEAKPAEAAQEAKSVDLTKMSVEELDKLCETDNGDACLEVALRYNKGDGVEQSTDKAAMLVVKACTLESGRSAGRPTRAAAPSKAREVMMHSATDLHDIRPIYASSESQRKGVIAEFKKRGVTVVGGVPVEELVVTSFAAGKDMIKKRWAATMAARAAARAARAAEGAP